jgi:hypothetical protein
MALKMSPVSRNLHAKVTLLGLELEDMLFLAMACAVAMLVGQFLFSDRYMFFLPMNWFRFRLPGTSLVARSRRNPNQPWHASRH